MWTFIERAQAPAALEVLAAEARNNIDRFLKLRNLDLYYGHLHIEYYYFCQQCENHLEVAGLLGHKCVLFTIVF